jgi:hypothetical protein
VVPVGGERDGASPFQGDLPRWVASLPR